MKNKAILLLSFFGLIGILFSCEKDETKVYLQDDPIKPSFVSIPELSFDAAHANDTLEFKCTPVDLGFKTSAGYYIEACLRGANFTPFANVTWIFSTTQDTLIKISVGELNKKFIAKKFVAGVPTDVDLRIRAVITVDAGTGSLGSSTNKFEVVSDVTQDVVTVY
jgi:starch-binding outer membrane protein SusE/F